MEEASVILFVVDCHAGLTGLDKDFAAVLRKAQKPVLLVANKADNASGDWMAHDFHALGMGTPYPIAAASGAGTGELLDAVVHHFQEEEADPA